MHQAPISTFREKPRTALAWWAMGLGLGTLLLGGPTLGIFAAVVSPALDRTFGGNVAGIVGFCLAAAALILPVCALVAGILALRKGERSWVLWVGFVPAILACAFWAFMIVGEFLFPH
ncbi:hypothetical protein A3J91_00090 [Candidatus Peribacteria bacterium RIFOXYC2_FULL_58_10]|nr:MAG: hypothetical protein A3J91_00090 [Candidatus Peribacteria bacterium RIFOXYC2_FULL_58_10]OGJ84131.1 MAG: hypothetical protein A2529_05090 [Candidatus Peribacteria bacterium RIFOXYD2_FULL_58_15]HAS33994.1 hypothetical protein [Candidatus Peribacteria bacterium]